MAVIPRIRREFATVGLSKVFPRAILNIRFYGVYLEIIRVHVLKKDVVRIVVMMVVLL